MTLSGGVLVAGLAAALVAFLLRAAALRRARRDRERLSESPLLRAMVHPPVAGESWIRGLLLATGAGLLGMAAVGAGSGAPADRGEGAGERETVLVLDASNSMLARDLQPSRLARERALATTLAGRLPGRVAVVYFAGRGYLLSPLTLDANAVMLLVESVRPSSVGRGGSAVAAGLERALDALAGGREGARKEVILFSDGEETVEAPLQEVLERAAGAGVRVHVVGLGTPEGARIPVTPEAALDPAERLDAASPGGFLRGPDGGVVVSRLEEGTLRRIAEATGGEYVRASDASVQEIAEGLVRAPPPTPEPGRGGASALLLTALLLLWSEGFLLRRA